MFVVWYDRRRGVGGAHRVGQETTTGMCNLSSAVVTADGLRWRQDRDGMPIDPADRSKQRLAAGGTAFVSTDANGLGLEVRDDDESVDLAFEGFYHPVPVWNSPEAEAVAQTIAPNHAESSGRARGLWGSATRSSTLMRSITATTRGGPRLVDHHQPPLVCRNRWSASVVFGHRATGAGVPVDPRWRDSRRRKSRAGRILDIVPLVEADGVSHRGGTAVWNLPSGESLTMRCTTTDGMIFRQKDFVLIETICEVRLDDSHDVGFCNLEMSNGIGRRKVSQALRAVAVNGLPRRPRR
ncbi:MAG: hypothetical protein ABSD32_17690 [Mycobacterium sp.]|jgi:hypothetical protein